MPSRSAGSWTWLLPLSALAAIGLAYAVLLQSRESPPAEPDEVEVESFDADSVDGNELGEDGEEPRVSGGQDSQTAPATSRFDTDDTQSDALLEKGRASDNQAHPPGDIDED